MSPTLITQGSLAKQIQRHSENRAGSYLRSSTSMMPTQSWTRPVLRLTSNLAASILLQFHALWKIQIHQPSKTHPRAMTPNYESWSKEELIARLKQLELGTKTTTTTTITKHPKTPRSSTSRPFHFASHPKRKIAIKFCYSGWGYNGLVYQNGPTPLPTVEDAI
ncbi:hypothetical protein AZE42_07637 [Rhizopogon vesiculosus]|uniref:Pseudouridine synthase I TruA alpha/beta domain-containing protein n=1 Tax=Rhizopogon vesiculosus TaxID=180088 RepID=A0A1J8Q495_9AGAM|nr:hypothetical protein AZE42_07637 [Rhizopogon vesiculosus]